jgi:hypothetical protein
MAWEGSRLRRGRPWPRTVTGTRPAGREVGERKIPIIFFIRFGMLCPGNEGMAPRTGMTRQPRFIITSCRAKPWGFEESRKTLGAGQDIFPKIGVTGFVSSRAEMYVNDEIRTVNSGPHTDIASLAGLFVGHVRPGLSLFIPE